MTLQKALALITLCFKLVFWLEHCTSHQFIPPRAHKMLVKNVGRCLQHRSSLTRTDRSDIFLPRTRGPRGHSASSTQPMNAQRLLCLFPSICWPQAPEEEPYTWGATCFSCAKACSAGKPEITPLLWHWARLTNHCACFCLQVVFSFRTGQSEQQV